MAARDTVAELAASMAEPCPDAALIEACEAFRAICEGVTARNRTRGKGHAAYVRDTLPERDRLEAFIIGTPARTPLGRRVKAETALFYVADWMRAGLFALPRSALLDLLDGRPACAAPGEPAAQLPLPEIGERDAMEAELLALLRAMPPGRQDAALAALRGMAIAPPHGDRAA
jgi:hypothetical protein